MKQLTVIWLLTLGLAICTYGQDDAPRSGLPNQVDPTVPEIANLNRAGAAALLSGDLDRAIEIFTQGTVLAPNEPAFWANKTSTLIKRAKTRFYNARQTSDTMAKKAMVDQGNSDLRTALQTSSRCFNLMVSSQEPANPTLSDLYRSNKITAYLLRAEANYFMTKFVDEAYAMNAVSTAEEYVAIEPDQARRVSAQLDIGEMLLFVGKLREAFETYQKILLADAANANALAGAGVSLINLGFDSGDKTSLDQGIEYLSRFVSEATSKHPLKASVEEALRYLKKQKVPFLKGDEPTPGTIEGGTVTGKALNLAPSPYPAIAAFAHVQGRVPVRVLIDEDGNVENAQAEGGHPLLQAAAVTAAFRAKFSPTIQSGKPVKVRGIIYYSFVDN